jgi:hypothetical protein
MKQYMPKINVACLAAALLLFFLPWTDVKCSGRHIASQSGFQSIYGGISLDDDIEAMSEQGSQPDSETDISMSLISLIVFLLILAGAAAAAAVFSKGWSSPIQPGALATAAVLLILTQAIIGFPIDRSIRNSQKQSAGDDEMARALGSAMGVESSRTAWFYIGLLALAVPAGLYCNERWGRKIMDGTAATAAPADDGQPA